jgi:hypothetical protein
MIERLLLWLSAMDRSTLYPILGALLAFAIQYIRSRPDLRRYLWSWIPDGARWMPQIIVGALVALADSLLQGLTGGALWDVVLAGAGLTGGGSITIAAILRELPGPWDGGRGGKAKVAPR